MARIYKDKRCLIVQNTFVDWKTGELLSPIETADYTIVQVAESSFIGGFETGKHTQLCDLELTIPLIGALTCFADEESERVEKNGVYLSFKGEKHRLYSKSSCRFLTLAVNFKSSSNGIFSALRKQFFKKRTVPNGDPLSLSSRIASEFSREARPFFEFNLNAMFTELLISLIRSFDTESTEEKASSDEFVSEIAKYIDCNFLSICSAEEICRFGYSYQHLCKLFKDAYGCSPGAYLFSKRMDHAAHFLSLGNSVSIVSHILGYSSPYNFSRAFKKHFGYPPSQKNSLKD